MVETEEVSFRHRRRREVGLFYERASGDIGIDRGEEGSVSRRWDGASSSR